MSTKHLVLGIDAAWTVTNPSGVALVAAHQQGWECLGLAPSYSQFEALSKGKPVDWNAKPGGEIPQFASLLAAASRLAGNHSVTLICIDMPLSQLPIVGRRVADSRISQEFGRYGCSTHSPSVTRPGKLADRIRQECEGLGFKLATTDNDDIGKTSALIEVYPHPALLALMCENYRIPYKVSRTRRYWPESSPHERIQKLLTTFGQIHAHLASCIQGISLPLPDEPPSLESLKRYEDALDALICAWVGTRFIERRCRAYGDAEAAVWVPNSDDQGKV